MKRKPTYIDEIDIDEAVPGLPKPDKGIVRLVKVLYVLGYRTIGSCEGHLSHGKHPYPWVSIYGLVSEGPIKESVEKMLDDYNQRNSLKWTVGSSAIRPEKEAKTPEELTKFQADATELAFFLFENYFSLK